MSSRKLQLTLATLCVCAFAVNVDTTLVNVALPRLATELGASTRELQWIVDAYTLVFAALVLSAGSVSDRFGRRGALITGLVIYGSANGAAALTSSSGALIATRALMGVGAAVIFPTTLSIISNVFTDRRERAKAIGLWGAATGAAVALGPIIGGALLESFSWQSTFVVKVPLALVAIGLVLWVVPNSRDPHAPRLDLVGFALSTLGVGIIVFAIIEAPTAGWASSQTLGLGVVGAALLAVFAGWEKRIAEPMLNLQLFRNPRFSGASLSITIAFFSLAGFIFLIVQYMQVIKGWSPLETGVRTLPVALAVGVSSVLGTEIAVRRGSKAIVTLGLLCMASGLGWVALAQTASTSYLVIAGQMVFLGAGMGLTTAPATESIMGSVSIAKAGVGSALNDMSRELGSTLGVAVVGSLFASAYAAELATATAKKLPPAVLAHSRESVGAAYSTVQSLTAQGAGHAASELRHVASAGFLNGLSTGCLVVAGTCVAGAVICAIVLPSQPPDRFEPVPEEPDEGIPAAGRLATASA
jgi:EmrB/QacA subfamily drug resistance transporter